MMVMMNSDSILPVRRSVYMIASQVPCSTLISEWVCVHGEVTTRLVQDSRQYERAYLAWETVRKSRNPFFVDGTGFEGYFVGSLYSPEQVIEALLHIGHYVLDTNARLYRYNHTFQRKLLAALYGEREDFQAIEVLAAQFGAALGRLRCNLLTNGDARMFQAETYVSTVSLPPMCYAWTPIGIDQRYAIATNPRSYDGGRTVGFNYLKPEDAEAGVVVTSIGKYGHPLVRAFLDERQTLFSNTWS